MHTTCPHTASRDSSTASEWRETASTLTWSWIAVLLILLVLLQPSDLSSEPDIRGGMSQAEVAALSLRFGCWREDGRSHPFPGGVLVIAGGHVVHRSSDLLVIRLLHRLHDGRLVMFCRR